MRIWPAAAVALLALTAGAPPADAGGLAPVPGSVRLGPEAADPAGGAPWTVRSWRPSRGDPRAVPPRPIRCLQVGQRDGARLVRTVRGEVRPLRWRDRTVCGPDGAGTETPPLLVERLLADRALPPRQTIVAGVARRRDRSVRLSVAGVVRELPMGRGRNYLAVLPGTVKRSELAVELDGADVRRIDMSRGDGYRSIVPGTVARALTLPAIDGGPDVALTTFQLDQLRGPRETCVEPGRVVGGEAGQHDPHWDVLLDAPTLADLGRFEDGAPPVAPPGSSGACAREDSGPELTVVRLGPGAVVATGMAGPGVAGIEVTRGGAPVPVSYGPGALRAFAAQVPSSGAFGERLGVGIALPGGEVTRDVVWLGRHDEPRRFTSYTAGGRRVRIHWLGGVSPPGAVTVREGRRQVRIRLTERRAPTFSDEGIPIVYPLVGISRCVEVTLRRPLGSRRVVDATGGGRVERGGRSRCRLSRR
jgi:hypothetical protein